MNKYHCLWYSSIFVSQKFQQFFGHNLPLLQQILSSQILLFRSGTLLNVKDDFLHATAVPQVLLWHVLAMGILSICLSVRLSRPGTDSRPGEIETPGLHHMSLESLVSYEIIWCHWVEIPLERWHQRGVPPLRNRYFTTIASSSVKTVADRHRLAAYHNKHC